jgi:hypothetical protein
MVVALFSLSSCKWKLRPTFPASGIAGSLRTLCRRDYQLPVEARYRDQNLQALVLRAGLFGGRTADLQGLRREAANALEHVLLCSTRISLSTDASMKFIQVKMVDVLTGSYVTLWRYVPDIRDSMYQRMGDTEYFNRLVLEIGSGKKEAFPGDNFGWDKPLTLADFLARQVISRVKRELGASLDARPDLSNPQTLGVVIENWSDLKEAEPERAKQVANLVHKSAQAVLKGYRFNGFRDLILRDNRGVAIHRWNL